MDPNTALPTQPAQPINPQSPSRSRYILIIIIVSILALVLLGLNYSKLFKKTPPKLQPTPTPSVTSKPSLEGQQALSELRIIKGKITSVTSDIISVNTGSKIETFSLTNLIEVGKVLDPSDGSKTKKVLKEDLKVGQNVQITTSQSSDSARLILIMP